MRTRGENILGVRCVHPPNFLPRYIQANNAIQPYCADAPIETTFSDFASTFLSPITEAKCVSTLLHADKSAAPHLCKMRFKGKIGRLVDRSVAKPCMASPLEKHPGVLFSGRPTPPEEGIHCDSTETGLVPSTACITTRFISHDMVNSRSIRPRCCAAPVHFPSVPCNNVGRLQLYFNSINSQAASFLSLQSASFYVSVSHRRFGCKKPSSTWITNGMAAQARPCAGQGPRPPRALPCR